MTTGIRVSNGIFRAAACFLLPRLGGKEGGPAGVEEGAEHSGEAAKSPGSCLPVVLYWSWLLYLVADAFVFVAYSYHLNPHQ